METCDSQKLNNQPETDKLGQELGNFNTWTTREQ